MLVQYSLSPNPTPPSLPQHFVRLLWQFARTHLYSWPEWGTVRIQQERRDQRVGKHITRSSAQWAQSEENKNSWRNRKPRQIVRGTHVNVTCVNVVRAFDAASRYQLHSCWFVCCKEKKKRREALGLHSTQTSIYCNSSCFATKMFSFSLFSP